jgi:hypothetical protein
MRHCARDACDAERLAAVQRVKGLGRSDHFEPMSTFCGTASAAGSASTARSNWSESCDVYIVFGRSFVHRTFRVSRCSGSAWSKTHHGNNGTSSRYNELETLDPDQVGLEKPQERTTEQVGEERSTGFLSLGTMPYHGASVNYESVSRPYSDASLRRQISLERSASSASNALCTRRFVGLVAKQKRGIKADQRVT